MVAVDSILSWLCLMIVTPTAETQTKSFTLRYSNCTIHSFWQGTSHLCLTRACYRNFSNTTYAKKKIVSILTFAQFSGKGRQSLH